MSEFNNNPVLTIAVDKPNLFLHIAVLHHALPPSSPHSYCSSWLNDDALLMSRRPPQLFCPPYFFVAAVVGVSLDRSGPMSWFKRPSASLSLSPPLET